ncbi:hypothetical protein FHS61_003166 [Altererythrobacter atlanticus]|uniref:hypothetical protein n=1 Tax=Croceibacterium atlanticum TaxID=1267766 RepID=UPI00062C2197|nr:hypothetical protein [Croceibacterium atlanticum]MBB5734116.1 hypothetical protein [Croceibacterium atlanticum]
MTEFADVDRIPKPGETARVVVTEVESGTVVYSTETAAWSQQLGAQVQWGATDDQLFFNRMSNDGQKALAAIVNPLTGAEILLKDSVYMVSSCGTRAVTCSQEKFTFVQKGYGPNVPTPIRNLGAPDDDGLFVVDLVTGRSELLLSLARIVQLYPQMAEGRDLSRGGFYGFHAKWNSDASRILFVVKWVGVDGRDGGRYLLTISADGSEVHLCLTPETWGRGHHPTWCPDDEHIVMNLSVTNPNVRFPLVDRVRSKLLRKIGIRSFPNAFTLRFGRFRYDGADREIIFGDQYGSGHPTFSKDGRYLLTDAYPHERVSKGDGSSPIRLLDCLTGGHKTLCDVPAVPNFLGPAREWRIDLHPAWDRSGTLATFNANFDGTRGVYLTRLEDMLAV